MNEIFCGARAALVIIPSLFGYCYRLVVVLLDEFEDMPLHLSGSCQLV